MQRANEKGGKKEVERKADVRDTGEKEVKP